MWNGYLVPSSKILAVLFHIICCHVEHEAGNLIGSTSLPIRYGSLCRIFKVKKGVRYRTWARQQLRASRGRLTSDSHRQHACNTTPHAAICNSWTANSLTSTIKTLPRRKHGRFNNTSDNNPRMTPPLWLISPCLNASNLLTTHNCDEWDWLIAHDYACLLTS